MKSGSASYGGFWALRAPEGLSPERFGAIAAAAAKAACPALAAEFAELLGPGPWKAASALSETPRLGPGGAFALDGALRFGTFRAGLRVLAPAAYPGALAAALGLAERGASEAFTAIGGLLASRPFDAFLAAREQAVVVAPPGEYDDYPGAETVSLAPLHEILAVLSDADLRRLVQNSLLRGRAEANDLALLLFRSRSPASVRGPVYGPAAFDAERLASVLSENHRLSLAALVEARAASPTGRVFLEANLAAYGICFDDLRRGALDLDGPAAALLKAAYLRWTYARRRRDLDASISAGRPLAALRALGPGLFRACVDRSDARTLGAAVLGNPAGLDEIAPWCSAGKLAAIKEEAARLDALLESGAADPAEIEARQRALEASVQAPAGKGGTEGSRAGCTTTIERG